MKELLLIVVGGLVGFGASLSQQFLSNRHNRSAVREANERATLFEVQAALLEVLTAAYGCFEGYVCAYTAATAEDPAVYVTTDKAAHDVGIRAIDWHDFTEARTRLRLLASRLPDDGLRTAIIEYGDLAIELSSAEHRHAAGDVIDQVDSVYGRLVERTGERLRQLG